MYKISTLSTIGKCSSQDWVASDHGFPLKFNSLNPYGYLLKKPKLGCLGSIIQFAMAIYGNQSLPYGAPLTGTWPCDQYNSFTSQRFLSFEVEKPNLGCLGSQTIAQPCINLLPIGNLDLLVGAKVPIPNCVISTKSTPMVSCFILSPTPTISFHQPLTLPYNLPLEVPLKCLLLTQLTFYTFPTCLAPCLMHLASEPPSKIIIMLLLQTCKFA